ncbi:hypothetical protein J2Y40_000482 [Chryseobacterium sp. 2987]|nr:hypothetical protein [Chryseobacterium sp. 2987]
MESGFFVGKTRVNIFYNCDGRQRQIIADDSSLEFCILFFDYVESSISRKK